MNTDPFTTMPHLLKYFLRNMFWVPQNNMVPKGTIKCVIPKTKLKYVIVRKKRTYNEVEIQEKWIISLMEMH